MADTPVIVLQGNGPVGWPKRIFPDQIMSKGSLCLVDHNRNNLSVIPAGGGSLPNIAWRTAKSILGSGDENTLANGITKGFTLATEMIMEISGKKGLHGIASQVTQTASAGNYRIDIPVLIRDYIYANPTHDYYISWWGYVTRKALIANLPFADGGNTASITTNRFFLGGQGFSTKPAGASARDAVNAAGGIQDVGVFIRNVTHHLFTGTFPATTANLRYILANFGPRNSDAPTINKAPSWIHYRSYLEDLTVSGRTYAEVDAIDLSLHTDAFAPGGRLFGDTFTNPATALP